MGPETGLPLGVALIVAACSQFEDSLHEKRVNTDRWNHHYHLTPASDGSILFMCAAGDVSAGRAVSNGILIPSTCQTDQVDWAAALTLSSTDQGTSICGVG